MLANRIFLMICVIAGFLLPNPCPAEGDGDRLKSEAQALFKVIVGDKAKFYGATSARCRVSIEWLGRDQGVFPGLAIPEDLAREFLGAQFYGEVVAPDVSAVPKEVLDPNSEYSGAFCSPEERQAYETEEEDLTDSGKPAAQ